MNRRRPRSHNVAALWAAMLLMVALSPSVVAQGNQTPWLDVVPIDTNRDDPNGGQWFYIEMTPGSSSEFLAGFRNPATVDQRAQIYVRDLTFSDDGTPEIQDGDQTDIGSWGAPEVPEIVVPAGQTIQVRFFLTVPPTADPGDHIGVVVAESEPDGADLKVIRRTGTRLYVTIPGEVTRSFRIQQVSTDVESVWWPTAAVSKVTVRNTGRVRLPLGVQVKGSKARGPDVLLSRHVESYIANIKVPWYGGPVKIPVEAIDADTGRLERVSPTKFIVPWGLLLSIAFALVAGYYLRRWWVSRASRLAGIRSDIRRLEALMTRPTSSGAGQPSETDDELVQIRAALKRARRAGSPASEERLILALHELGGSALDDLLGALVSAGPERRKDLIAAATSYGEAALLSNPTLAKLPPYIRNALIDGSRKGTGRKTSSKKKPGGKSRANIRKATPSSAHKSSRKSASKKKQTSNGRAKTKTSKSGPKKKSQAKRKPGPRKRS